MQQGGGSCLSPQALLSHSNSWQGFQFLALWEGVLVCRTDSSAFPLTSLLCIKSPIFPQSSEVQAIWVLRIHQKFRLSGLRNRLCTDPFVYYRKVQEFKL